MSAFRGQLSSKPLLARTSASRGAVTKAQGGGTSLVRGGGGFGCRAFSSARRRGSVPLFCDSASSPNGGLNFPNFPTKLAIVLYVSAPHHCVTFSHRLMALDQGWHRICLAPLQRRKDHYEFFRNRNRDNRNAHPEQNRVGYGAAFLRGDGVSHHSSPNLGVGVGQS
jgi:hypothetical protein